jgi:Fe-S cluster assembly protein SufD
MIALPTNRDENWRYANLRPLAKAVPRSLPVPAGPAFSKPAGLPNYEHWVFVDGHWIPELSTPGRKFTMWVSKQDRRDSDAAFQQLLDVELATAGVDFSLARVNAEQTDHVLMVYPSGELPMNVELSYFTTQSAEVGTSYPRVQIHAARGSRLNLVERHCSVGDAAATINAAVDIGIAPGASVEHVRVQNVSDKAACFDTLVAHVGERASYALRTVTLGGLTSRSTMFIKLAGRAARCELTAATVANGIQTHDIFAEIEHAAPETVTRELFRGIATDRGKLAFNGKIIVRGNAHESDSEQSLKSLLTGSGAEAAARPQLEIYTDRVRAAHGATTGKLDDQMLFYLLSRGIERTTARALLQWAFIEDAVSRVTPALLREDIERAIVRQLSDVASLDGLLVQP